VLRLDFDLLADERFQYRVASHARQELGVGVERLLLHVGRFGQRFVRAHRVAAQRQADVQRGGVPERVDPARQPLGMFQRFLQRLLEERFGGLAVLAAQTEAHLKVAQECLDLFRHQAVQIVHDLG
jgi:hypothetical protein